MRLLSLIASALWILTGLKPTIVLRIQSREEFWKNPRCTERIRYSALYARELYPRARYATVSGKMMIGKLLMKGAANYGRITHH